MPRMKYGSSLYTSMDCARTPKRTPHRYLDSGISWFPPAAALDAALESSSAAIAAALSPSAAARDSEAEEERSLTWPTDTAANSAREPTAAAAAQRTERLAEARAFPERVRNRERVFDVSVVCGARAWFGSHRARVEPVLASRTYFTASCGTYSCASHVFLCVARIPVRRTCSCASHGAQSVGTTREVGNARCGKRASGDRTYPPPSAGGGPRSAMPPSRAFDLRRREGRMGGSAGRRRELRGKPRSRSETSVFGKVLGEKKHARSRDQPTRGRARVPPRVERDLHVEWLATMRSRRDTPCGILSGVPPHWLPSWVLPFVSNEGAVTDSTELLRRTIYARRVRGGEKPKIDYRTRDASCVRGERLIAHTKNALLHTYTDRSHNLIRRRKVPKIFVDGRTIYRNFFDNALSRTQPSTRSTPAHFSARGHARRYATLVASLPRVDALLHSSLDSRRPIAFRELEESTPTRST